MRGNGSRTYSYPDEWLAYERAYLPENRLRKVVIAKKNWQVVGGKPTVRSFGVIS